MKSDNTKALPMWNGWFRARAGVPVYDPWLDDYRQELEARKDQKFLDLGCGIGANTLYLIEHGYGVISGDYSMEGLRSITDHIPGSHTTYIDMNDPLPFGDGSLGVIVADISLHYFDSETTRSIMQEIKRVLRSDGILLARVSSMNDTHYGAGSGRQIEPRYYDHGSYAQRYFTEEDVHTFFGIIGTVEFRETAMTRAEAFYSQPKMLYQIKATKTDK